MSTSTIKLDLDFTSIPNDTEDGVDVENSTGMPVMTASCFTRTSSPAASCQSGPDLPEDEDPTETFPQD